MIDFLASIAYIFKQNNVQATVYCNGALEPERFDLWKKEQIDKKAKIDLVFNHLRKKGTSPPRHLWVIPTGFDVTLRLALKGIPFLMKEQIDKKAKIDLVFNHLRKKGTSPPRHLWVIPTGFDVTLRLALKGIPFLMGVSLEDHRKELVTACFEKQFTGILSDDAEIALLQPPRYFSIRDMKLVGHNGLATTEIVMDEVAKALDVNPNRFCMIAVLLGNHILSGEHLGEFHRKLVPDLQSKKEDKSMPNSERLILSIVKYVRSVPKIDDFERIAEDVFGSKKDPRKKQLLESFQYYSVKFPVPGHRVNKKKPKLKVKKHVPIPVLGSQHSPMVNGSEEDENDIVVRIALDLVQLDINEALAEATGSRVKDSKPAEKKQQQQQQQSADHRKLVEEEGLSIVQAVASGLELEAAEDGGYPTSKSTSSGSTRATNHLDYSIYIPAVHSDVCQTVMDRHSQGNMSPQLYQLLTKGEIKFPALMESPMCESIPVYDLFADMRKSLYAVLFNLNHLKFLRKQFNDAIKERRKRAEGNRSQAKKEEDPTAKSELLERAKRLEDQNKTCGNPPSIDIRVREWLPYNDYVAPKIVYPLDLSWPVPTLQRLWFGNNPDDKQKRLRAFFSCLRSDDSPPLIQQGNVPQHLLLMACVLRYIMTTSHHVFKKPELDAFLVTAFSSQLRNAHYLASLQGGIITPRGVHIASLFMAGIEMAILVNEGCGAPVPLNMCLPWTFFDGALFQHNLRKAIMSRNLFELCDGQIDLVCCVERMRGAIVYGIAGHVPNGPICPMSIRNPMGAMPRGPFPPRQPPHEMGMGRLRYPRAGGQLVVGGSVVSNWGGHPGGPLGRGKPFQHFQNTPKTKKKAKTKAKEGASEDNPESPTPSDTPPVIAIAKRENSISNDPDSVESISQAQLGPP
ncbi:hypothetical protein TCAL_01601 [Tigriopus californicus]|uniref:Uncharacterized protein n=1 Tax=Tigriopus californicus TaxID=6832 RepID=A0A553PAN5_TIGCA|nr:hypothetical protein TCAL_01601 [Tigriopus californicus]|eukprot:TCALIF_01601-PA protein Name:"Similar to fam120a Constitutive coactivator of PPAR-gamma-like protein 1 homolog (Xenopus tropicalis)" AED:0.21 eAED:0.22 QI:0/0.5/0.53/1/0.83/0.76/13/1639/908